MEHSVAATEQSIAPIAIGGVGGSGTRIVAWTLMQLGVKMPGLLNQSLDNLWFTLLFKRRAALIEADTDFAADWALFLAALEGGSDFDDRQQARIEELIQAPRQIHSREEMETVAQSLLADHSRQPLDVDVRFGWKEPNTHVFLERFLRCHSGLRYIHVMRHGMDMAFSDNQNQLNLWGSVFLDRDDLHGPRDSLSFWCAAHQRIDRIAALYENRVLTIKFEDLCAQTIPVVKEIAAFLDINVNDKTLAEIDSYCVLPQSVGRRVEAPVGTFAPEDVEYIASKGYLVE